MNVVTPFATDAKPAELVQPTDGSFHYPTKDAQATAMFCVSSGKDRLNTASSQLLAVWLGIVGAIALDSLRSLSRAAALTPHWRNRIDQRHELGHVMSVGTGYRGRKGNAVGIGDQVMFAAGFAAIRWIGSRFFLRAWHGRTRSPRWLVTSRFGRPLASVPTALRGSASTHLCVARHANGAKQSFHCPSPVPAADTPKADLS